MSVLTSWPSSVETRRSWTTAIVALGILSISYGAPLVVVVGLKPMQASLGVDRSALALAASLAWVGTGLGGVAMGPAADRIGLCKTVVIGAVMIAAGLCLAATGQLWAIFLGNALLIGLIGNGALYAPLLTYVSHWFDRRRGTAIALVSSGPYAAGAIWPYMLARGTTLLGWRLTMLIYAGVVLAVVIPLALSFQRLLPEALLTLPAAVSRSRMPRAPGGHRNATQALLCLAAFFCCVPMALPNAHLVALCSDLGVPTTAGATMLSVLLGCAFLSRQFWGAFADRNGGLRTIFVGSSCQAVAVLGFSLTENETGLFLVAAAFGLGFAGILPAYVVAVRDLFPSSEASWRVPLFLLTGSGGMAFGSWWAGLLYDRFGYYAPAFEAGVLFNLANLAVIGFLIVRHTKRRPGLASA